MMVPARRWVAVPVNDLFAEADRQQQLALTPEKMRNNPGFGKPLQLKDNPFDQGMGMAYRMLRNAGFNKLPWMEDEEVVQRGRADLMAAVRDHLAWLREAATGGGPADRTADLLARHARAVAELRERAEALRRRIETFNLTVPIVSRQMMNVNPDRVASELEEAAAALRAALGPGEGGGSRGG
jgi:hypothetical protein